ncbi:2-polyprenyl-3-methyl-6-methoxy-1,4-benzoquinone monooxygenase [Xylophilus sp. GOD-11R]|uniref:2-polyprenyl-3-methyl-6-methoxy-1,4-benzoquinone monooxygenase n=1 Tax=Xylophilus sp. GOD-11R TaxID=3089814 RepID=UPI00298BFF04|nr:2-polyprenyl-3-methyl-6-methoxy-1,4-benzoquinone monooxygenase [Xylophilus sp. GOD-11R]WPB57505.1 2-polyprenyl-3-methyl-6-methoxy-1,4-benzoquinone monooxygenase [Xylophilus sp. GOD-11R]
MEKLLRTADAALRTLFAEHRASRPTPVGGSVDQLPAELTVAEKKQSAAFMRVNHVGEVCAQALYTAQAAATRNRELRAQLEAAAREETDHLAWTRQRLDALGSRPSLLNPLWYAGAFALGLVAGRIGDEVSLGFVAETEDQVSEHLDSHLKRLPAGDTASRAIVAQMKVDEEEHASEARHAGAVELPGPVRSMMRGAARIMTTTAHYI